MFGSLVVGTLHGHVDHAQLLDHELLSDFADVSGYLSDDELLDHLIQDHVFLNHLVAHDQSVCFVHNHLEDRQEMVNYRAVVHFLYCDGTTLKELEVR